MTNHASKNIKPEAIRDASESQTSDRQHRVGRSTLLGLLAASLAAAILLAANCQLRFSYEGGAPIVNPKFTLRGSRLQRSYGWPRDVLVRLNWAETISGELVVHESMRPKEESFHWSHACVNVITAWAIAVVAYVLTRVVIDRQFSLRHLMLLALCTALLIMFLTPNVRAEIYRRQLLRDYQQFQNGPVPTAPIIQLTLFSHYGAERERIV